jgi:hypothetical protein
MTTQDGNSGKRAHSCRETDRLILPNAFGAIIGQSVGVMLLGIYVC